MRLPLAGLILVGAALGLGGCQPSDPAQIDISVVPGERAATRPVQASDAYYKSALAAMATRAAGRSIKPARNIILFVGDGMGVSTVTAGRIYAGQRAGRDGESYQLAMDTLPHLALAKTYSHDAQVSDSASTAMAMLAGIKTRSRTLGLDQGARYNDCPSQAGAEVETLFDMAERAGLATGLVTTTRLTHATPAAAFAVAANRDWEDDTDLPAEEGSVPSGCIDIARQFIDWPSGDGFEIALGGGRRHFLPTSAPDPEDADKFGRRGDGTDLIAAWQAKSPDHVAAFTARDLARADLTGGTRILGLFEHSHMEFDLDRASDTGGEPSLAEMTRAAIKRLSSADEGYVLLVEGGRIDHGHHAGNAVRALQDLVAFDDALRVALEMIDTRETLVIVTADHSHTLTISGYPERGNAILGKVIQPDGHLARGADGLPYTTLGYANGPGGCLTQTRAPCTREDLSKVDTEALDYRQQATVPLGSETHGGEDVPVFAIGPGAELVAGVMEQNEIFHIMGHASGLVDYAEPR